MAPRISIEDYDLDQELDEHSWLQDHPVYCPIPHCNAHNNRFARCGDADGDYVGIHKARLRYAKGEKKRVTASLHRLKQIGIENPGEILGLRKVIQDAIDCGFISTGKKGRRKLF